MSVVSLNLAANRLVFAGLGNVEVHLWLNRHLRLSADRGIVGSVLRTLHPVELDLTPNWFLGIHTDGISARFEVNPPRQPSVQDLQAFADNLLRNWARQFDDATVVVAAPN